jgi:hypothetical protein
MLLLSLQLRAISTRAVSHFRLRLRQKALGTSSQAVAAGEQAAEDLLIWIKFSCERNPATFRREPFLPSTKQYSPLSFEPATAQQDTNGRWMPTEFGIQVQERQL